MRASSGIDPAASLGTLVAERPARASLFEALHLDYCCGGGQTLAQACAMRSLEIDAVRSAIEALDQTGSQDAWLEDRDWRRATLAELCAHIVAVHHDGLREALPRIEALLCTVVRVHGSGHPELRDLQRAFSALRAQLEPHLASEEDELFPACLALERHGSSIEEALLEEHEHEHASVGEGLAALRLLGGDYEREHALCATHRALLDAFVALELDLHQHIHEENNVLLPRVRELAARMETSPTETACDRAHVARRRDEARGSLPLCCQAWIAEQSRAWH